LIVSILHNYITVELISSPLHTKWGFNHCV